MLRSAGQWISGLTQRSEFIKNVVKLTTGTVIAQAIPILIAPILSRLYTPDNFGQFAFIMSIVSAIAVISTARYELSIMLPKSEEDAVNLVSISFVILGVVTLLVTAGVIVYNTFLAQRFPVKNIPLSYFYFIPLMVLLLGIYQVCNYWANRQRRYNQMITTRITNTAVTSASNLSFGFARITSMGLIVGAAIGQFFSSAFFLRQMLEQNRGYFHHVRRQRIAELLKTYDDLPKVNTFQALVDMFQVNGMIYLLTAFFTSHIVGLYSLCIRIMQAPVALIGAAISQVFFQQSSSMYHDKVDLAAFVRKTIFRCALLGLPFLFVLVFFGPALFAFVFGEQWRASGEYARLLAPWIYCDFIRSPISQIPIIINKQKQLFAFSVTGNIILVVAMLFGGKIFHDERTAFLLISSGLSILFILIIFWVYRSTKQLQRKV